MAGRPSLLCILFIMHFQHFATFGSAFSALRYHPDVCFNFMSHLNLRSSSHFGLCFFWHFLVSTQVDGRRGDGSITQPCYSGTCNYDCRSKPRLLIYERPCLVLLTTYTLSCNRWFGVMWAGLVVIRKWNCQLLIISYCLQSTLSLNQLLRYSTQLSILCHGNIYSLPQR